MKGQRRHELERNELADWLAKTFAAIKPYQNAILGVVLLVVVVTVGYSWWARQSAGGRTAGWDAFHEAFGRLLRDEASAADFDDIARQHPDTNVALWAGVLAGDLHLAIGCNMLFVNKGMANQELRDAEDDYLRVLGAKRSGSEFRERATFGLARARESQGNLQKAVEHYEEVRTQWPDGAYAKAAAARLEDLKRPETRLLYDRFAKFDPKPASLLGPDVPGTGPAFDPNTLREDEPLFEPKFMDLQEKGEGKGKPPDSSQTPPKPADTQPSSAATPSTEEKPAGQKPPDVEPGDTGTTDAKAPAADKAVPDEADAGKAAAGKPEQDKVDSGKTDTGRPAPSDPAVPAPEKND
jgi:tetratricopeptide (TPR) repeat protein